MNKQLSILLVGLLLLCLSGCQKANKPTPKEVADSIADISSDSDGNVMITLVNGKQFTLGNLKGADGKDGKDGKDGINGLNGRDGINGANGVNGADGRDGLNGRDGTNGKDGETPTDYLKKIEFREDDKIYATYGDNSEEYLERVVTSGMYSATVRLHYGDQIRELDSKGELVWTDEGKSNTFGRYIYLNEYGNPASEPNSISYKFKEVRCDAANVSITGEHDTLPYRPESPYESFVYCKIGSMPANNIIIDFYYQEYKPTTIIVPATQSFIEMQEWASQYNFVSLVTSYGGPSNTYDIFDQNGRMYSPGSYIFIDKGNTKITITYYLDPTYALSLNSSYSENRDVVYITANYDSETAFESWAYDGLPAGISASIEDTNKIKFTISDNEISGAINVYASTNHTDASTTISYSGGRFN